MIGDLALSDEVLDFAVVLPFVVSDILVELLGFVEVL
jgi:hypothetical protein